MSYFGQGIVSGLAVTFKHMLAATGQVFHKPRGSGNLVNQVPTGSSEGIFTVQYPEERLKVPERFRYFPMLIVDAKTNQERCTSCGICAKVCPPQCIWIVRSSGPDGKPIPQPAEFVIDSSICMQCGLCAEYCPFDAIKMNHVYELSTYERIESLLMYKKDLLVSEEYYAQTHPTDYAQEEAERHAKEEADRAKEAARAARPARPTAGASPVAASESGETSVAATPPSRPAREMNAQSSPKPAVEKASESAEEAASEPSPEPQAEGQARPEPENQSSETSVVEKSAEGQNTDETGKA